MVPCFATLRSFFVCAIQLLGLSAGERMRANNPTAKWITVVVQQDRPEGNEGEGLTLYFASDS